MFFYFSAIFFSFFLFFFFFRKKIICLLLLEMIMIFFIFVFYNSLFYLDSLNYIICIFLSCFMVLDSVFSITLLISSSRNSSFFNFFFKNF